MMGRHEEGEATVAHTTTAIPGLEDEQQELI
jgi:hypothetical protein